MRRKQSKRLDFLPNAQNKYSIRKFAVGTASILVGATLVFGSGHEAQAAEEESDSSTQETSTNEEVQISGEFQTIGEAWDPSLAPETGDAAEGEGEAWDPSLAPETGENGDSQQGISNKEMTTNAKSSAQDGTQAKVLPDTGQDEAIFGTTVSGTLALGLAAVLFGSRSRNKNKQG
nr:YSIRK-type signal peptide-containing protein [Staphylococcus auricularis]